MALERAGVVEAVFAESYLGNAPIEIAYRAIGAVSYPHDSLEADFQSGCTEPYIAQLVSALLTATGGTNVLECGGFIGTTSAWLALTLQKMGGGTLHVAEMEPERAQAIDDRLYKLPLDDVKWHVHHDDVFNVIASMPEESLDFVFVDDNHVHAHVDLELAALLPKMKQGGIITGHDVTGSCDLQKEFAKYGGYSLDLPRLGPAGGLGIIQVP